MNFIIKLIILLEFYAIYQCKAYVLPSTTTNIQQDYNDHHNNDNVLAENQLTELGITQSSLYINNMVVKPSDIKVPTTLQEIVNYIGADKLDNTAVLPINEENKQQTLTYTELSKLLAFWQWAKEQNFYETQTDQPSNSSENFVTYN